MKTTTHKLATIHHGGYTFTAHADLTEDLTPVNVFTRATRDGSAMAEEMHGDECWSIVSNTVMNLCTATHWRVEAQLKYTASESLEKLAMLQDKINKTQE